MDKNAHARWRESGVKRRHLYGGPGSKYVVRGGLPVGIILYAAALNCWIAPALTCARISKDEIMIVKEVVIEVATAVVVQ